MSTYDELHVESKCPFCGNTQEWHLQYHYGHCWNTVHHVGDEITWSDDFKVDHGERTNEKKSVQAMARESCLNCGKKFIDAVINLENNKLVSAELLQEEYKISI